MSKVNIGYFQSLFALARKAGVEAGMNARPQPVTFVSVDINDKPIPGAKEYYEPEGLCGFAWITIYPGNCPAANAAKKLGIARKAYGGGVQIWVSDFDQSMARKEAYAQAYAKVLQEAGLKAYAGSRLD